MNHIKLILALIPVILAVIFLIVFILVGIFAAVNGEVGVIAVLIWVVFLPWLIIGIIYLIENDYV